MLSIQNARARIYWTVHVAVVPRVVETAFTDRAAARAMGDAWGMARRATADCGLGRRRVCGRAAATPERVCAFAWLRFMEHGVAGVG